MSGHSEPSIHSEATTNRSPTQPKHRRPSLDMGLTWHRRMCAGRVLAHTHIQIVFAGISTRPPSYLGVQPDILAKAKAQLAIALSPPLPATHSTPSPASTVGQPVMPNLRHIQYQQQPRQRYETRASRRNAPEREIKATPRSRSRYKTWPTPRSQLLLSSSAAAPAAAATAVVGAPRRSLKTPGRTGSSGGAGADKARGKQETR